MKLTLKPLMQLIPALIFCTTAQAAAINHNNVEMVPSGKGYGVARPLADSSAPDAPAPTGYVVPGYGISYHNGPIMTGTNHIYYIWYGNWTYDTAAASILNNLAKSIGGSPYFNINTTYSNGTTSISNAVTFTPATGTVSYPAYPYGKALTDMQIAKIVTKAIVTDKKLPADPNGIYFVLTSKDVTATSGFGTKYCGWHSYSTIANTNIKFAFVGDPRRFAAQGCEAQSVSPNSNPAIDGMASVIIHELEEAITDPNLNAWYDSLGNENADKCAWKFGTTTTLPSGAKYNMTLGTRKYLIQANWVNAPAAGYCALSY